MKLALLFVTITILANNGEVYTQIKNERNKQQILLKQSLILINEQKTKCASGKPITSSDEYVSKHREIHDAIASSRNIESLLWNSLFGNKPKKS